MMKLQCQILAVLFVVANAEHEGSSVNVTSGSVVVQPSSYNGNLYVPARQAREYKTPYAFKPRAAPLKRTEQPQGRSLYYSQDDVNKYKTEILFPGNYFPIAKEKSTENATEESYNPLKGGPFYPKAIPLMRGYEKRSLDLDEVDSGTEKPRGFSDAIASRRSISSALGLEDEEEENEEEEEDYEVEEDEKKVKSQNKVKVKAHKYRKYMLPLLLAYKMKYFALVPVLVGGLILLVGATGMAGFFFALFAAVMGLQKGGGY